MLISERYSEYAAQLRQHAGQRAIEERRDAERGRVHQRVGGLARRLLERLGEQAPEHAGRVQGERERAQNDRAASPIRACDVSLPRTEA
jgi:hypothetical protein